MPTFSPRASDSEAETDAPRLHMIGHAHIDLAWLWRWPEGMAEVLATFRSALDLIAQHPEFVFSCGSAAFYEFVEQADPVMFSRVASAVASGRWEVLGGFWVEPDTNVNSGEALMRHALFSQRYFATRFGVAPTVAFNPDAFGHCAGLPQILTQCGFEAYFFMRPEPIEQTLPFAFAWRSPDGSTIGAYRIPLSYCTGPETLESHLAAVRAELEAGGVTDGVCFYGVGNHGGGPTRANLSVLDAHLDAGEPLAYSSPQRYLAAISEPRHLVCGELGYHARGAYSANSLIKAALRRTDAALVGAEVSATLATVLLRRPYPAADLDRAWKELLCAGFHDVAAGTVISSAADDALAALSAAAWTAERITAESELTLAWHTALSVEEDEQSLVVFNPHPWDVRAPVEAEVAVDTDDFHLVDDADRLTAVQEICSEAVAKGRRRITFLASVPACGWSAYRVRLGAPERTRRCATRGRWVLDVDPGTGGIKDLRLDGAPVLSGSSAYVAVAPDASDTWAHGVTGFGRETTRFRPQTVEVLEDGPVRRAVRTTALHGRSTVVQDFVAYHDWDRLLVHVRIAWAEHHVVAKLRFATGDHAEVNVEVPYATVVRPPDGREYPGGSWIAATGPSGEGFCIANDAKFGYDVAPGSFGMTIVRSPLSAHHDPAQPAPDSEPRWLDQGEQCFTYVVARGSGATAASRVAAELLRPARPVAGAHHTEGPLAAGVAHLEVEGAALGAVKRSEGGQGTVVRVHNAELRPSPMLIRLEGRGFRKVLGPNEFVTVLFADDIDFPPREVGPLEVAPDDSRSSESSLRMRTGNAASAPSASVAHGNDQIPAVTRS